MLTILIKRLVVLVVLVFGGVMVESSVVNGRADPDQACLVGCQWAMVKIKAEKVGSCVNERMEYQEGIPQLLRCF